jgi:aspartyl-tRNA(Asn)/glutamyl-tRNA(Gln) amidotransferase subunit C
MSAGDPRISLADVEHVARLARLALSPDEKERMRRELNSILGYIDKLLALDTEGVPPTLHAVPMTNVLRADEPAPSFPQDEMLANAPDPVGALFRVPRIIEE